MSGKEIATTMIFIVWFLALGSLMFGYSTPNEFLLVSILGSGALYIGSPK